MTFVLGVVAIACAVAAAVWARSARMRYGLIATIEDDDDVQNVYSNFEIDDEILQRLTAA